jgi:hypothetical protein
VPVLLIATLLGSCSLDDGEHSSVALTLEVDKVDLPPGESMRVTAIARNIGSRTITLSGPADCLIYIEVRPEVGSQVLYNSSTGCSGASVTEELEPAAQKIQTIDWQGQSDAGIRVPSGNYILRGIVRVTNDPYLGPGLLIRVE